MQKATTDDIGAICSRIDAQTIVMIELLSELSGQDFKHYNDKYTKRYDRLAKKIRKEIAG